MLSVTYKPIMLSVVMLSAVMLTFVMLIVIMLSAVAQVFVQGILKGEVSLYH
jgi:hypothetical protein